ncbi:hypothetical protein AVEN_85310-1 [Araneus ventricosus]|uniref:Uncharacterized protein n=1 Tax=Araneus ventricosus TaxID=182803 RepID=A0A4Y2REM0_ARAVE|nr:hypothetical protein AVEN_85310-1 [Araneus ventricosus]
MKRTSSESAFSATAAKNLSTFNNTGGFTADSIPQHHYHLGENNYAVVSDFGNVLNVHIRKFKTNENGRIFPTKNGVNFFTLRVGITCYRNGQFIFTIRDWKSANRQRHIVSNQCMDRKCSLCLASAICHETRLFETVSPICVPTHRNCMEPTSVP